MMPKLDNWKAQNPVVYYKSFLDSKQWELNELEIEQISKALGISSTDYKALNGSDIIVVRTPILG